MDELSKVSISKINISASVQQEKFLLGIPKTVKVPQGAIVQWNIVGLENFLNESSLWRRGLIVTLYFSDKSPFHWKRQFVQLQNFRCNSYITSNIIRLAEEMANEKGDYKYGIQVTDGSSDETILFDEDPYLVVY